MFYDWSFVLLLFSQRIGLQQAAVPSQARTKLWVTTGSCWITAKETHLRPSVSRYEPVGLVPWRKGKQLPRHSPGKQQWWVCSGVLPPYAGSILNPQLLALASGMAGTQAVSQKMGTVSLCRTHFKKKLLKSINDDLNCCKMTSVNLFSAGLL